MGEINGANAAIKIRIIAQAKLNKGYKKHKLGVFCGVNGV